MTSIITGDIINSRNNNTNLWLSNLKEVFNTVGKTPKTWEIYRGDSFQVEIESVEKALLFAINLKAILKKTKDLDVRVAIGIGKKEGNHKNITEGNGEAFINSGKAFDTLLKKQNLAVLSPWKKVDNILNTSISLGLLVMDNWTVNSATFVAKYLENRKVTQKLIAKDLQISESSASERRKRAGLDEIMQLEKLYSELIIQKLAKK